MLCPDWECSLCTKPCFWVQGAWSDDHQMDTCIFVAPLSAPSLSNSAWSLLQPGGQHSRPLILNRYQWFLATFGRTLSFWTCSGRVQKGQATISNSPVAGSIHSRSDFGYQGRDDSFSILPLSEQKRCVSYFILCKSTFWVVWIQKFHVRSRASRVRTWTLYLGVPSVSLY